MTLFLLCLLPAFLFGSSKLGDKTNSEFPALVCNGSTSYRSRKGFLLGFHSGFPGKGVSWPSECFLKNKGGDFPGGPVAKTMLLIQGAQV